MENFGTDSEKGIVSISVNPKLYSLDVVYSAAYIFTEKCYVLLDGDPLQEIIVELKPKFPNVNLEELGREFNNELINYANYDLQFKKNIRLREILLQKILLTNVAHNTLNVPQDASQPKIEYLETEAKPWKKDTKNGENSSRQQEEPSETFV